MYVNEPDARVVRGAKWLRKTIDDWKTAYAILFPPKPKPAERKQELPFSLQIAHFIERQERLDGRRPTLTDVAKKFNCHRTTISRHLAKVA